MQLSLAVISHAVNGQLLGQDKQACGVSIDSRSVQPGQLYIAIKGQRFDGHDFVPAVTESGAVAVLVERPCETSLPQIVVADTHLALAELAGYWRRRLSVKVAGVTGSNGKTTVKEMIAAILATAGNTLYTQGNLNNDIGVPLTLLRLTPEHRYAVIEMGANHPGEIAYTSRYAQADVSLINNVGPAHIEGFGSLAGVAAAKGEIISSLSADGIAVLNRDDAFYDFWRELTGSRAHRSFGFHPQADIRAEQIQGMIENGRFITRFELKTVDDSLPIQLNLAGEHNVKNALAAATVALSLGLGFDNIQQGLANVQPVTGRIQPLLGRKGGIVIDDSYNANPASLQAALSVLQNLGGECWLAMGAFGELGEDSTALHRQMGRTIKTMGIKRLFATGALAKHSAEAFGDGAQFFDDQTDLITTLDQAMTGQEILLVKGSRSQKMENVVAALVDNFRA